MIDSPDRMYFLDVRRDPDGAARKIVSLFDQSEGDMGSVAESLGLSRSALHRWIAYLREVDRIGREFDLSMEKVREKHAGAIRARFVETGKRGGRPPTTKKKKARRE